MTALNTVLFSTLLFVAGIILQRLISSKDGVLRKIMISYFSAEALGLIALIVWEAWAGDLARHSTQILLFLIFVPKLIPKIFFYFYLRKH